MNNNYILFLRKYQNSLTLGFLLLLSLIYVAYITWGILGIGITPGMDDPYIIDHSVNDILNNGGKESRFIDSSPWDGITSPVFFGLTLFFSLFMPVVYARLLLTTLSILLLISGLYIIGKKYKLNNLIISLIILFSLSSGFTTYQLLNGLETGMAMATIPWIVIALDEILKGNKTYWGYILAGILYYIRPELAALTLLFGLYIISERPNNWLKGLIISLLSFISISLVLYIFSGNILANTMSAKTYFFLEACHNLEKKYRIIMGSIKRFQYNTGIFFLGFYLVLFSKKYRVFLISFIAIFLFAYFLKAPYYLYVMQKARYFYLLFPISVIGWIALFNCFLNLKDFHLKIIHYFFFFILCAYACIYAYIFDTMNWLNFLLFSVFTILAYIGYKSKKTVIYLSSICIALFFSFQIISYNISYQKDLIYSESFRTKENFEVSQWIEKNTNPDEVILIHDAGLISQIGKNPLIDMVGLKTKSSIKIHKESTYKQCSIVPQTLSTLAKNNNAKYMIVTTYFDTVFKLRESLEKTGWTVERADKERIGKENKLVKDHYYVYKITPPKS